MALSADILTPPTSFFGPAIELAWEGLDLAWGDLAVLGMGGFVLSLSWGGDEDGLRGD